MTELIEPSLTPEATPSVSRQRKLADRLPKPKQLLWFATVAIALIVVAFVKIPAYDYGRYGLETVPRSIRQLWWAQIRGLPDVANDALLAVLFVLLVLVFVVGAAALLWFALLPSERSAEGVVDVGDSAES